MRGGTRAGAAQERYAAVEPADRRRGLEPGLGQAEHDGAARRTRRAELRPCSTARRALGEERRHLRRDVGVGLLRRRNPATTVAVGGEVLGSDRVQHIGLRHAADHDLVARDEVAGQPERGDRTLDRQGDRSASVFGRVACATDKAEVALLEAAADAASDPALNRDVAAQRAQRKRVVAAVAAVDPASDREVRRCNVDHAARTERRDGGGHREVAFIARLEAREAHTRPRAIDRGARARSRVGEGG